MRYTAFGIILIENKMERETWRFVDVAEKKKLLLLIAVGFVMPVIHGYADTGRFICILKSSGPGRSGILLSTMESRNRLSPYQLILTSHSKASPNNTAYQGSASGRYIKRYWAGLTLMQYGLRLQSVMKIARLKNLQRNIPLIVNNA